MICCRSCTRNKGIQKERTKNNLKCGYETVMLCKSWSTKDQKLYTNVDILPNLCGDAMPKKGSMLCPEQYYYTVVRLWLYAFKQWTNNKQKTCIFTLKWIYSRFPPCTFTAIRTIILLKDTKIFCTLYSSWRSQVMCITFILKLTGTHF